MNLEHRVRAQDKIGRRKGWRQVKDSEGSTGLFLDIARLRPM